MAGTGPCAMNLTVHVIAGIKMSKRPDINHKKTGITARANTRSERPTETGEEEREMFTAMAMMMFQTDPAPSENGPLAVGPLGSNRMQIQ